MIMCIFLFSQPETTGGTARVKKSALALAAAPKSNLSIESMPPTYTPQPTYTPLPTYTQLPLATSIPPKVVYPTEKPVVKSISPDPADEFVRLYWSRINQKECESASNMQSPSYQNSNGSQQQFTDWCLKWDRISYDIHLISANDSDAKVRSTISGNFNGSSLDLDLYLYLVSNGKGSWLLNQAKYQ